MLCPLCELDPAGDLLLYDEEVAEDVEHGLILLALGVALHEGLDAEEPHQLVLGHGHLGTHVLNHELVIGLIEAVLLQELPDEEAREVLRFESRGC